MQKLKHFCAYSERSHADVKEKLYELGVPKKQHDEIISILIEKNYLNEERFALAFASGKHRINQWGNIKIKHALLQKKISPYCINKALKQIDEESYMKTLEKLAADKYASLKGDQYLVRKKKTIDYLLQKGYETDLIIAVIKTITDQ